MGQRVSACCSGTAQKLEYQQTPRGSYGEEHVAKCFPKIPVDVCTKNEDICNVACLVDNPQGAEACMQQYSQEWQGAYLMYSERDAGSMYLKWSQERVEGALAFFQPAPDKVKPSSFKYNNGGQKQILMSKVGITGQGRTDYYRTWLQFIRECWKFKGVLTVLEAEEVPELKVKIVMLVDENDKIIAAQVDQPMSLEGIHAVVVAQPGTTIFDGLSTMAKDLFIHTGHPFGAATALTSRTPSPQKSPQKVVLPRIPLELQQR